MLMPVLPIFSLFAAPPVLPPLPTGPRAPVVVPEPPSPTWSWDFLPTSFHGAVKDRDFTAAEVLRLARYQMTTIEKWYTPCGSARAPHQSGPACAVERKAERLFARIKAAGATVKRPRPTAIMYWNSMFDFSMYSAHAHMVSLEVSPIPRPPLLPGPHTAVGPHLGRGRACVSPG